MSERTEKLAAMLMQAPLNMDERLDLLARLNSEWLPKPPPEPEPEAEPKVARKRWKPEEDAALIAMRKAGRQPRDIGPAMGRTAAACSHRLSVIAPELADPMKRINGAIGQLHRAPNATLRNGTQQLI